MECELLTTCIFLNDRMANQSVIAEMFKQTYCRGRKLKCARYAVFVKLGIAKVPPDLFPSATDRAKRILQEQAAQFRGA